MKTSRRLLVLFFYFKSNKIIAYDFDGKLIDDSKLPDDLSLRVFYVFQAKNYFFWIKLSSS